jgi:RNA polymerase sigma-70 factor (ECF subfamily)
MEGIRDAYILYIFGVFKIRPTVNLELSVDLIRARDEKGLAFLYDNYANATLGIIVRIIYSREHAEEILQQTFLKVWTKIESYDPNRSTFFTWLARIARNTAIDHKRLKKYENNNMTESLDINWNGHHTSDDFSGIDVEKITNSMDKKYKEVLDCVYLLGHSHIEASELLELPIGTVKSRLRKSISIMRESLKNEKVLFTGSLFLIILLIILL